MYTDVIRARLGAMTEPVFADHGRRWKRNMEAQQRGSLANVERLGATSAAAHLHQCSHVLKNSTHRLSHIVGLPFRLCV